MIQLKGIHGTTQYHSANIDTKGFVVPTSGSGKGGRGIYFWNYLEERDTAILLAKKWWEFACSSKQKIYDLSQDCTLVSYDVSMDVNTQNLLDFFEKPIIKEKFLNAYPIDTEWNEFSYGAKLDDFISNLEKKLNSRYDVVRLGLSVPHLQKVAFSNSFPALVIKNQINVTINDVIRA